MPLNLFRRTPQGAVLATDHPLFRLLHDAPNQWQTSMELRESMILDVLCLRQSFVEKASGRMESSRLYPLSAGRMVFVNPLAMYHSAARPADFALRGPAIRSTNSDD